MVFIGIGLNIVNLDGHMITDNYSSIIETVGNTPLIKLEKISEETKCDIYGKAEFFNPGQSVKDRIALSIITHALDNGYISKGGIIVEGTAGNTGIGLSIIGRCLGLKTIVVMPNNQSQEKKEALSLAGATIVEVPPTRYSDNNHYTHYAKRLANVLNKQESCGAYWANQFDNTVNMDAHYRTTAMEIWDQTNGNIDGFVCSVGSGGTLAGVSAGLKERKKDIKCAIADPYGSSLYSYYKYGVLEAEGNSIMEGIGQSRITANLHGTTLDMAYRINDAEAIKYLLQLLHEESLCLGGSSGINVAGAVELAKQLGPGKTIVTMLCDHGSRYASKLFNNDFLKQHNLPEISQKTNMCIPDVLE